MGEEADIHTILTQAYQLITDVVIAVKKTRSEDHPETAVCQGCHCVGRRAAWLV